MLTAGVLLGWPGSPLHGVLAESDALPPLPVLAIAAIGLGVSWLSVGFQALPKRRLVALLLGPWVALVLLTQSGLFSDRSPDVRLALQTPAHQQELRRGTIQAAAAADLSGSDHAQLILLALATPNTPHQLLQPTAVPPGQRVWIRRWELGDPRLWRLSIDEPALQGWVLAERQPQPAGSTP